MTEKPLPYVHSNNDALNHAWRRALRNNNLKAVSTLMSENGISPNMDVSPYRRHPLTYFIESSDLKDPHAIAMAQLLSSKGAELNVPDYKRAVPADYALVCDNSEVAFEVFYQTFAQGHKRKLTEPYKPHYEFLIQTTMNHEDRGQKITNLARNLHSIRNKLEAVDPADPDRDHVAASYNALHTLDSIDEPSTVHMFEALRPSTELNETFQAYKQIQRAPNCQKTLKDLAYQGEHVRYQAWYDCRYPDF